MKIIDQKTEETVKYGVECERRGGVVPGEGGRERDVDR